MQCIRLGDVIWGVGRVELITLWVEKPSQMLVGFKRACPVGYPGMESLCTMSCMLLDSLFESDTDERAGSQVDT